ncbi:P-loop containing nucleoside triphosphate hydrolase protein [Dunaliella salina]|uniref:Kinesin-like protein n=1 Tax=Dunaliella salina TaxID=3046 RepID=A0ABQ7H4N0_DUNSA|nr:P-loop containing nucleoside triphosphate hydrolase protein [Dunaliella salina]|eukprot:KAF5841820.1 P-loop containing nucleoside triphosphate hydrolase protein [Dunaliella salina]
MSLPVGCVHLFRESVHVHIAPVASPSEVISSRLTLVDLAGSERSAQTGATDGTLRDESLAINKSLFTLRQVVLALSANSSQQQQQQQVPSSPNKASSVATPPGSGLGGGPSGNVSTAHVPYRDSKLTALLKNSLGGNTLTTMIACISPTNAALEENISTLEYAARAKRVTNQVTINEDPKTRVIRELRAEVAFLRSQLAALHGPDAAALAMPPPGTLASHPPTPLALPAGSPRLPGMSVPAGDGLPMSPNKAGLPPRPPLPPSQPRMLQIKGDASPASSSPSSPSRVPGAHSSPSPLAPVASPMALSRSGSAEALGSNGGPNTPSARGLLRTGSLDAVDGPPRASSMPDGGVQVASSQPQLQQQPQQRGAVAALTDLASLEQVGSGPALPEGESFTSVKAQLLRATHMDVGVLAHKLLDAVGLVQQVSNANQQLRKLPLEYGSALRGS